MGKDLEQAKKDLEQAKADLADAEAELADMAKYDWSVMPRSYNGGVGEISMFSDVTNNLIISMAALFIIVGLLVSYFAVSRIVNEQITQIGTKKALGIRRGEVTTSYLLYSGIAVVTGSIVGGIVACFIVEGIIGSTLASMFVFGAYPAYFGWGLFLAIFAIELVLVLGATYLACRRILKKRAIDLLRGPEPPAAKAHFYEKWGIWEKLPLLIQTIVNNCVNDKRRVLSTIVGVAGCAALIVTAITLNNDVMKSYYRQYDEVYDFNAIAYAESEPEGAVGNLESALKDKGATTAQALKKRCLLEQPNGESGSMNVIVPIDEKKREIIVLMINGFSVKDARHCVSYDNVVLTALGIIVGLVLGCIMGSVTVASVEPVTGEFVKSVDEWAVAIGILGGIVLSAIMALISLRRVNRFKLTNINRF